MTSTSPTSIFFRASLVMAVFLLAAGPLILALAPRLAGTVLIGLIAFGWAVLCAHKRKALLSWPPVLGMTALLALMTVSTVTNGLWAHESGRIFKIALLVLALLMATGSAYALAPHIKTQGIKIFIAATLGAFALIILTMVTNFLPYRILNDIPAHMRLPQSLNNQAAVAVGLLAYPLMAAFAKLDRPRLALAIVPLMAVLLGIFTRSETALLSLGCGAMAMGIACIMQRKAFVAGGIVVILVLLSAPWLFTLPLQSLPAVERAGTLHHVAGIRADIWNAVSMRTLEKPLLGHGVEAASHITDFEFSNAVFDKTTILHPHNGFLQIWLETGAIGAVAVSIALLYAAARLTTVNPSIRLYLAGLLAAVFPIVMSGYGLWQSWWIGSFIYALFALLLIRPTQDACE